jgi:uncharacterized protein (TIGR02145 family)
VALKQYRNSYNIGGLKMKNLLMIFFIWTFLSSILVPQTTWYVSSSNGDDDVGNGSQMYPYRTISKITNTGLLQDDDVINVAAGIYNESPAITKNITINGYSFNGNTDIVIDVSVLNTSMAFKMDELTKFTSTGGGRFYFKGTNQAGIYLVTGEILLEHVNFYIEPPFLFQGLSSNTSNSPTATWYADINLGDENFDGLSANSSGPTSGPLPFIFHVYTKVPFPYSDLANDVINVATGNYSDAPVILNNVKINGYQSGINNIVTFDLTNTDLHFCMPGSTSFSWAGASPQNRFIFLGSVNTGIVFKSGCVEVNDVPFEIQSPFLFKLIPSYCDVDPPTIDPIPFVVYANNGHNGDDGYKIYHTIAIGNNCWLKENLDVGTRIDGNQEQIENDPTEVIEKYCYNNEDDLCKEYGGLYQWTEAVQYINGVTNSSLPTEALTGNVQGICPDCWHIPSWTELFPGLYTNVGGYLQGGPALKAIETACGDGTGTNASGFSALFAGIRDYTGSNTTFKDVCNVAAYWSTAALDLSYNLPTQSYAIWLSPSYSGIGTDHTSKTRGFSIRCIHDTWQGIDGNIYTGIDENEINKKVPNKYSLSQNYPNPFNPSTTIIYEISKLEKVKINIYDIFGRLIKKLVDKQEYSGKHSVTWDGKDNHGKLVSSGNYFYQIISGDFVHAKKMILLK